MVGPEIPLDIKIIRGCGRDNFPFLVRESDKVFCVNRETKGEERFSRFELRQKVREALCAGSDCVYQTPGDALEFRHSETYLQYLREKSYPI